MIELGHPALITISNFQNINNGIDSEASISRDQYCSGTHYSKDGSKCESHLSLPAASIMGKIIGYKACSDVAVTSLADLEGVQFVKFEPKISKNKLSVCYKSYDIGKKVPTVGGAGTMQDWEELSII